MGTPINNTAVGSSRSGALGQRWGRKEQGWLRSRETPDAALFSLRVFLTPPKK